MSITEKLNGQSPAYASVAITERESYNQEGLTKREYFAAMALQGLMVQSIPGSHNLNTDNLNKVRAKFAVNMADAVLCELDNNKLL